MPVRYLAEGPITFSEARRQDRNIVHELAHVLATEALSKRLWENKETISDLVKYHLQLSHRDTCRVASRETWIRGSFNICIPVEVEAPGRSRKLMMRCPMPHKLAESRYPGTVDEKLSCEVGTYAWIQDNCPDLRIPFLYAFGFSDQRHFTHEQQRPWYVRLLRRLRRGAYRYLGYAPLSHYTKDSYVCNLPSAYMLLEFIGPDIGQMLSISWDEERHDPHRRRKLFRGIAHVMLSLARVPMPRIGAFRFCDDCTVTLTNRPLTCTMMILENDGATRTIQDGETYSHTEPFVSDMLTLHDEHFISNPNATFNDSDCHCQMAIRTLLRALSHHYIERTLRNGPFFLQFTDFHASNVFVNKEWDITCILDLEWVCSLPAEMLSVPYWLTGRAIDGIDDAHYDEFEKIRQEFMLEFLEEQQLGKHGFSLADIMENMWKSKGVWYWYCLNSVNAMRFVLEDHVYPVFSVTSPWEADTVLSAFWRNEKSSVETVEEKVAAHKSYEAELRREFCEDSVRTDS